MKEKIFKSIAIISLAIAIISIVSVFSAKREISNLNNTLNNVNSRFENLREDCIQSVESAIEEYDNSFAMVSYEYGDMKIDAENHSAKVHTQVLPKSFNPGNTKVYLVDDENKRYPLDYADGMYTGDINIPLFAHLCISHVVLDDNGTLSNQMLNWNIAPDEEILPEIYIHYYGDISLDNTKNKNEVVFTPDFMMELIGKTDNPVEVKGSDIVVQCGDKEIDRIKLEKNIKAPEEEPDIFRLSDSVKRYEVKPGEILEFYVEVNEDDLVIRRLLDTIGADKNGNAIENEKLANYQFDTNITVKHKGEIIYDIRDKVR